MMVYNRHTINVVSLAVGSPGFPRGGANFWGCQPIIWPTCPENCIKMKKFWARGARVSHPPPPPDPPLCGSLISQYKPSSFRHNDKVPSTILRETYKSSLVLKNITASFYKISSTILSETYKSSLVCKKNHTTHHFTKYHQLFWVRHINQVLCVKKITPHIILQNIINYFEWDI